GERSGLLAPELRQRVEALGRRQRVLVGLDGRAVDVGAREVRQPGPVLRSRSRDESRREHVRPQRGLRRILAAHDADPGGRVDDRVRARVRDRGLGDSVLGEVAVLPPEREDLVGSVAVAKLVLEGATDEAGSAREQHLHRRRVYSGAVVLLAALALAGCDHGKRRTEPKPPPAPKLSFVALDREHQRLVRDYEDARAGTTAYAPGCRAPRAGGAM